MDTHFLCHNNVSRNGELKTCHRCREDYTVSPGRTTVPQKPDGQWWCPLTGICVFRPRCCDDGPSLSPLPFPHQALGYSVRPSRTFSVFPTSRSLPWEAGHCGLHRAPCPVSSGWVWTMGALEETAGQKREFGVFIVCARPQFASSCTSLSEVTSSVLRHL